MINNQSSGVGLYSAHPAKEIINLDVRSHPVAMQATAIGKKSNAELSVVDRTCITFVGFEARSSIRQPVLKQCRGARLTGADSQQCRHSIFTYANSGDFHRSNDPNRYHVSCYWGGEIW